MDPLDPSLTTGDARDNTLPGPLRAGLTTPRPARKAWQWGAGPQYIGLFLWVAYFDQLPRDTAAFGGVGWSSLGVLLGGILATLLLYRVPAAWGFETGQPLAVLATSTFGVRGATWVPGLLLTLVQPLWMAIAAYFATDLTLKGLVLLQLLDPKALAGTSLGGVSLPGRLFMVTSLAWILASAFTGKYLVRVIAALMNIFPIISAGLLGLAAAKAFGGLPEFRPLPALAGPGLTAGTEPGWVALLAATQTVLGFFAASGLASADWGAASLTRSDVRQTGWVGVAGASTVVGVLAILTVAGAAGEASASPNGLTPESLTFHAALPTLFGPRVGGLMFLALGLAALAPSCYAAYLFGTRLNEVRTRLSRTKATALASALAWALVLAGIPAHSLATFGVLGGLLAPALGALAADSYRAAGSWPGPRSGWNRAGVLATLAGMVVGLAPSVATFTGPAALARWQPATLFGFVAAFVAYLALAKLGLESPSDERPAWAALAAQSEADSALSA